MCGIFGAARAGGPPLCLEPVRRAVERMRHRGPDDCGYLAVRLGEPPVRLGGPDSAVVPRLPPVESRFGDAFDVALGFRRLAVQDPSAAGHQPMGTVDGRFWIVFNGEIYNFPELRRALEAEGARFSSRGDAEVLLAAYACWGRAALSRLVGMFALAVLDLERRALLLARDLFGIKPLYWTHAGGRWAFASEPAALLEVPGVERRANPARLQDFLRAGLTDHSDETLFAGIRQLPPGHLVEVRVGAAAPAVPERFARPCHGPPLPADVAEAQLREAFLDSVRIHVRSDVPTGAGLSGGIDSTAIVAAMRRLSGAGAPLPVFSYVADDPACSDAPWIAAAERSTRAEVHRFGVAPHDAGARVDALLEALGEPCESPAVFAQYRLFEEARRAGVRVVLNGQGADELLGGYASYLPTRLASLVRAGRWWAALRLLRGAAGMPRVSARRVAGEAVGRFLPMAGLPARGAAPPVWLDEEWLRRAGAWSPPRPELAGDRLLRSHLRWTLETTLPALLRCEDRTSMAFSIESRVPFLTPQVAAVAGRLSDDQLISAGGDGKAAFRRALRDLLPPEVADRKGKVGFASPSPGWVAGLLPWAARVAEGSAARAFPALYPASLRTAVAGVRARIGTDPAGARDQFAGPLWYTLAVLHWAERFDVSLEDTAAVS